MVRCQPKSIDGGNQGSGHKEDDSASGVWQPFALNHRIICDLREIMQGNQRRGWVLTHGGLPGGRLTNNK